MAAIDPKDENSPPSVVIFDLGGVLMDFAGLGRLAELTGRPIDADLRDRWAYDPAQRRLEVGECTPLEFADAIVAEWDLALSPNEFIAEFASWPVGPFGDTIPLLQALHGRVPMGCLSNTNAIHWQKHLDHRGVAGFFDWTLCHTNLP